MGKGLVIRWIARILLVVLAAFSEAVPAQAIGSCSFFNTSTKVCILNPDGTEDCSERWFTEVHCFGGIGGGMGFLPYFPGGGTGGPGPVGRPQGDSPPTIKQQQRLNAGKELAKKELESNPTCAALKQQFNLSDERSIAEMIAATTYRNWSNHPSCGKAHIFTFVKSDVVYVCQSFENVSASRAAELVIHEALHSLGLTEAPNYSNAPTSAEIDAAVQQACSGL